MTAPDTDPRADAIAAEWVPPLVRYRGEVGVVFNLRRAITVAIALAVADERGRTNHLLAALSDIATETGTPYARTAQAGLDAYREATFAAIRTGDV